jgi:hypothetical protein
MRINHWLKENADGKEIKFIDPARGRTAEEIREELIRLLEKTDRFSGIDFED